MTDGRPPQAGVLKASVTGGHAGGARALKAVIQFLAKIGPELLIEAFPDRCVLRAINTSLSAYAAAILPAPFFASYDVFNEGVVRAGVPMKHVLAALRSARPSRVTLELAPMAAELRVVVAADSGLLKTFRLAATDAIILQANVDGGALPAGFAAVPAELGTLLASLGPASEASVTIGDAPAGAAGHAPVELRSHATAAARDAGRAAPTAALKLGGASASLRAVRAPPGGATITLSSRDLRSLLPLCETLGADVELRFGPPGSPALATPAPRDRVGGDDGTLPDVRLVLATLDAEEGDGVGGGGGGGPGPPPPGAPPPEQRAAAQAPPRDPYAYRGASPAAPRPPPATGDDDDAVAGTPPDERPPG